MIAFYYCEKCMSENIADVTDSLDCSTGEKFCLDCGSTFIESHEVDDYNSCPYCLSDDIEFVRDEEYQDNHWHCSSCQTKF